ncbi:MAG: hypothetical protein IT342_20000 [Candidatus Melainabacteria bacterium]|nr:hypothetical protein [Candidatus Melainabacteria bacterium]
MSLTTPLVIAGLTFSPLVASAILLGMIVIACSVTGFLRRKIRFKLQHRYSTAHTAWSNIIRATANVDQALRGDRFDLVNGRRSLTGKSKETLDAARKEWAFWSAQRTVVETTLKEAEELNTRFCNRKWWQLSHRPLKTAIHKLSDAELTIDSACLSGGGLNELSGLAPAATQTGTQLSSELEAKGAQGRSTLESIQSAIRRATEADRRVRETVSGQATDNIAALKNRLHATQELPFAPYEASYGEVNASLEAFATQVKGDPLTEFSGAESSLRSKISALRSALIKALDLYKSLLTYRQSLSAQCERVAELRRTPLKPGYPDAIDAEAKPQTFRFAEDDSELDCELSLASTCSATLTEHLHKGEATAFERVLPSAQMAVVEAKHIVDAVVSAKQAVDEEMNAILDNSTKADLEADAADSDAISVLYTAQKWRQARVSVSALYGLHVERVEARNAVANLLAKQAANELLLTRLAHIFSPSVDELSATIAEEASRIKATAQLGRTDWAGLMVQIAAVLEQVCGIADTSLAERIKLQTDQYEKAQQYVRSLVNKLDDLIAKSGDSWGGAEAAAMLADIVPSVKAVEKQAEVRKQDWVKLQLDTVGVQLKLNPAENLIGGELAADGKAFSILTRLEADIAACQNMSYRRVVNGVCYGYGIYCQTTPAMQLLERAYAAYQLRHYDEALREADEAQVILFDAHLESWWLCLQMMSMSSDAPARQFAQKHGYADYGLDTWKNLRIAETAQPIGSTLPVAAAAQRYNLPLPLDATATEGKAASDCALAAPGDIATAADYEIRHAK